MLTEIYYEVDEFNKQHLGKIAAYAAGINWYSKRRLDRMTMSEIMTILIYIYYHYSHYKNFKSYYEQHVSKELKRDFPDLVGMPTLCGTSPWPSCPCCASICIVASCPSAPAFISLTAPK